MRGESGMANPHVILSAPQLTRSFDQQTLPSWKSVRFSVKYQHDICLNHDNANMKFLKSLLRSKKKKEKVHRADADHTNLLFSETTDRTQKKYELFLFNFFSSSSDNVNISELYSMNVVIIHEITENVFNT